MKTKPKIGDKVETKYGAWTFKGVLVSPNAVGTVISDNLPEYSNGGVYAVEFSGKGLAHFHHSNIKHHIPAYRVWKRKEE